MIPFRYRPQGQRIVQTDRTFKNERLTYRLNIVAQQAIAANDEIFLRKRDVGFAIFGCFV